MSPIVVAAVALLGLSGPAQAAAPEAPDKNIVGGEPAPITDAPWQVGLLRSAVDNDYEAQFCGGSVLSADWVVTAAHCVVGNSTVMDPSELEILAGKATLAETPDESGPRTAVADIIPNPAYDEVTAENDVALVQLASPLPLDGVTISPIDLPTAQDPNTWPAADTPALITGWGSLTADGNYPTQLQKAVVPVVTDPLDPVCGNYGADYTPDSMLCGGLMVGGVDTCYGDSGGPFAVNVAGTWTLAGITSWGEGCALPDYPGVYTRVTSFDDWILAETGPLGPYARVTASPFPVDFGPVPAGQLVTETVMLTNDGDADMITVEGATEIVGPGALAFQIASTTCDDVVLQPTESCDVEVAFEPPVGGDYEADLRITSDAVGSPSTVPLLGLGLEAMLSLDRVALDFGVQRPGTTTTLAVTATSEGNEDLTFPTGGVSVSAASGTPFAIAQDNCSGTTLELGDTCDVIVSYSPAAAGSASAELLFASNDPDSPQRLPMSGLAESPGFAASPSSLAFGNRLVGTTYEMSLQVTNTGDAPMMLPPGNPTLTGPDAGQFSVVSTTCSGVTLPKDGFCRTTVSMTPTSTGAKSASLVVADNAPGTPHSVAVTGTGTLDPQPPAAPKGVKGKATSTSVKARWKAVTGATSYTAKVTGKSRSHKVSKAKTTKKTKATIKVKLKPGSKYRLCVQALGSGGYSEATCTSKRAPK